MSHRLGALRYAVVFLLFTGMGGALGWAVDPSALAPSSKDAVSTSVSASDLLILSNEFIKIIVTHSPEAQGRFAIETTGGDPKRDTDNDQPLVYGRPKPWSSYSTFLVGGTPYIFGGATSKRAGKSGYYGKVVSQTVKDEAIVTVTDFGSIRVTQYLSLVRNPFVRVKDTALIAYKIENLGSRPEIVGGRIVLDTMLGQNDGAPFRIGAQAITGETQFSGSQILDYWQVFDSLSSPNVIAQGTLQSSDLGIAVPDRMALVNWGTLADSPWEFGYQPGRSFVREGEAEKDTALALYWNPDSLAPGEVRWIKTLYGLGGVSLAPGALSLGLSAPSEILPNSGDMFMVVGYILNSGGFDSANTVAAFDIPDAFQLMSGSPTVSLGTLPAGETRQVALFLKGKSAKAGDYPIRLRVTSGTVEPNQITRAITILPPPQLKASVTVTPPKNAAFPYYSDVNLTVSNPNALPMTSIEVQLLPSAASVVPSFESAQKWVYLLNPSGSQTLNWKIGLTPYAKPPVPLQFQIRSSVTDPLDMSTQIPVPDFTPQYDLTLSRDTVSVDDVFYVTVWAQLPKDVPANAMDIYFNPSAIRFVRSSILPEQGRIQAPTLDKPTIIHADLTGISKSLFRVPILKLHFKAETAGDTVLEMRLNGAPMSALPIQIQFKKTN